MNAAAWLLLLSAPLASGLHVHDKVPAQLDQERLVVNDEISATSETGVAGAKPSAQQGGVSFLEHSLAAVGQGQGHSAESASMAAGSNRHLFSSGRLDPQEDPVAKQRVLDKVARAIEADKRGFFANMSRDERKQLASRVLAGDTSFVDVVAPPSLDRPVILPPFRVPGPRAGSPASFLESSSGEMRSSAAGAGDFQPSADFLATAGTLAEAASTAELPYGVGSPRTGDSLPVFHYSAMPAIDVPKEWEYSLDAGDTIKSFSNARQDVKLLTQLLKNITQGFFLDTNAGDGEHPSNTLLLELMGWRGLIMEPRGYKYLELWSKFRKAWLFLGCISPHENHTMIGFDTEGNIDMLSGHMIHAYNMKEFMSEMGGRTTIDFWNLNAGGYEAEILNETLLGVGSFLEFGVILVRFDGRRTGRGYESFVQHRSKDDTEELIFEILHNASFKYVGGLDAYWINHVSPRFHYKDVVFVNPSYYEKRGFPVPQKVRGEPPPALEYPGNVAGHEFFAGRKGARRAATDPLAFLDDWDSGLSREEETKSVVSFIAASKAAAASLEPPAKAVRSPSTKLVDYYDSPSTDA